MVAVEINKIGTYLGSISEAELMQCVCGSDVGLVKREDVIIVPRFVPKQLNEWEL